MNVSDAAYITGHDHPGGAAALAPRMGMSGAVLSNKLNPNMDSHHLTLAEAMRLMVLTGDVRILNAMAGELHYMAVPIPAIADDSVMHAMTATVTEFGAYIKAVGDSLDDGRVTKTEVRNIGKELGNLMARAGCLMALLETKANHHG